MDEEGVDEKTGKVLVKVETRYFRPAEVEYVLFPSITTAVSLTIPCFHSGCSSAILQRPSVFSAGSARSTSIRSSRRWSRQM